MPVVIFYTEHRETLDLFFADTIQCLREFGIQVKISVANEESLFNSSPSNCRSTTSRSSNAFSRLISVYFQVYKAARLNPDALHVYLLPMHIVLSPLIFLLTGNKFSIVSQGQLEGEGLVISTIYRLFLSIAARFSLRSFSCNIFESFRWYLWPFYYLSKYLKPLPWYGLTLSRAKVLCFKKIAKPSTYDSEKPIVFGYLGRLCESKGCIDLLKYFCNSKSHSYFLKMTGPAEHDFQKYLFRSNLNLQNITIEPPIKPSMVTDWFSSIDIYITFSRGESIGAASIEALLAGKPVISMINSGACQILRHCVDSYIIQDVSRVEIEGAINYVISNYNSMSRAATQISEIDLPMVSPLATELLHLCLDNSFEH